MCLLITRLCMPVFAKTKPWAWVTEGTVGWATVSCGPGNFGVRGQAKRDPALARSAGDPAQSKRRRRFALPAHSKGPACHLSCGLLCKRGDHFQRKKKPHKVCGFFELSMTGHLLDPLACSLRQPIPIRPLRRSHGVRG